MATLSSTFKLYDGYTSTIDKISSKSEKATSKILAASGATDKLNGKLNATGASASNASSGLGKLIGIAALAATALKGISITDEYTNTAARLDLINDGLQTQQELQDKIFASANRSKGSYTDMAGAISKMGLTAGDAFGSNDELIGFTELLQKSFKVGGASGSEQSSGMQQLTQAMAAGKLQGDEFRSIMENAPMVAQAIADYTGKTKGELKQMSTDGLITADIIKNSMFAASQDINDQFSKMPYTFADIWTRVKNGGLQAFDGVMEKINDLINTPGFQDFVNKIVAGFDLAAQAAGWLIDTITNGWSTIGPILGIIGGVLLIAMIVALWAMVPPLIAQAVAWLAIYWPLLLIIAVIAIVISAIRQFGASWSDIFGVVGGVIGTFAAAFYNIFVVIWNVVATFINFFGNVFKSPIASIKTLFLGLATTVLGFIENMAQGIQDLLNKIPGVSIDMTSGIESLRSKLEGMSATIKSEAELTTYVKSKDFMDYSDGYTKGSETGVNLSNSIGKLGDTLTNTLSDKGGSTDPTAVKGTGSNGAVDVAMSSEDLQYLRDASERKYTNKFSTSTLAPNINIKFGNVTKEADADKVAGRIKQILQEEIATAAEGAY